MRPAARIVALLLVAALVVGAGGLVALLLADDDAPAGPDPARVPTTTPQPGATTAPRPGLARFYAQRLRWRACRSDALCATLTVPLDYRQPDGETIGVAVLKVPAADPDRRIGSLVVNPGGPGASGVDYADHAAAVFRAPLRDRYDIVGFDPRGAGASAPVDCLTDDQLDAYVAEDPDPDTPAEVATYADNQAAFARGCAERSGALAAHVTTVEAARDVDVLRAALGESSLDWFGASYGTKLGATYADLFPGRVGRMVLDGAVDLSIGPRELSLQQARGFETALRSYVDDCLDDGCFLGDSVEEALRRLRGFLDDVDADPLPTDDGDRRLQVGNAFYGIVVTLYSRSSWRVLTQALEDGLDGDGTLLLRLSDLYHDRTSRGYADNSTEANYAINCLDDPWSVAPDRVPVQLADFERASPTFGAVFAWGLTSCRGWRLRATDRDRQVTGAGAPPIVVVGTTRDPATPYAWAVHLADQLESGVLISRDGDGHTGYHAGNECVDEAVERYLIDGTVPRDGLRC